MSSMRSGLRRCQRLPLVLVLAPAPVLCYDRPGRDPCGRWRLDKARSESLRPYLTGLGMPGFVAGIVDRIPVDLQIGVQDGVLTVADTTFFGENSTTIALGGAEVEKDTRNKRKKFMISAYQDAPEGQTQFTVKCRLFQRGDGWCSLQSFAVQPEGTLRERYILKRPDADDIVVTRVFQTLEPAKHWKAQERQGGSLYKLTGVGLFAGLAAVSVCFFSAR
ncbi:unnamed protein product [Effrenium voratum]|nr:unnamed protein product [Effrenium voratum]